jgi:hypothetical protein
MKKTFLSLFAVVLVGFAAYGADTNSVVAVGTNSTSLSLSNAPAEKTSWPMELTLGGSGVTNPRNGDTEFGLSFSFSVQPLKQPIWFGISQDLGWSPSLEGATDLDAAWSWKLVQDKLYLNTGWSVGVMYDRESIGWRTGPELSLEYYTKGNAFIIAGVNYDLMTHTASDGWQTAKDSPLRYFFGVGIAF